LPLIIILLLFVLLSSTLWVTPALAQPSEMRLDLQLKSMTLPAFDYRPTVAESERRRFVHAGLERSYYRFVPKRRQNPVPVLIALHGAGRTGASMLDSWAPLAAQHGFVVIAPDGINQDWDMRRDNLGFIQALVQQVATQEGIVAGPWYLFGHSSGGKLAIVLAAQNPQTFARVAAHAASLPKPPAAAVPLPAKQPALAIFLGDNDAIFSIASARDTTRWLDARGFDARLFVLQRHNHWYYADAPRINETVWAFLKPASLNKQQ